MKTKKNCFIKCNIVYVLFASASDPISDLGNSPSFISYLKASAGRKWIFDVELLFLTPCYI